jgi:hypothetical protein
VQIENLHQNISAYALANAGNRLKDENRKLVFDKVGGQYFLREVVSTSQAVEFPKSQSEKRAQTLMKQSVDTDAKTFTAEQN